ncbi:ClpX, ATPase regulatory subunit [Hortaea werneckii]|nr:ClpX, ATPase regulatory subunit [Hortaea werneckii]KAI7320617.1 ClpX, ATPase regulatory subunit [Hortaea werneckii]
MASARPPSVSPQARPTYLAISSILRGRHSRRPPVVCLAHRPSTPPVRRPFSTALRRNDGNGSYMRSDFANQGFTGYYEPREQTPGPLSGSSPTGAPKITPKLLKDHLDAFVVGQDRAKKALATAVYNHYQRIQELQRREEEEEELLAQQERRRMSDVHRHPVEGREGELKRGIRVPSLTADWPEEDEFPGQQATTSSSAIHMPSPGSVQKGGEWGPGGYVQSQQQQQQQQQQSRHSPGMESGTGFGSQGLVDNTPLTIEKSNILLLGPSGVGKTLMAKTLARVLEVPFSMSDCTPFTQAGYIGEDAEVCVQRLLAAANYDVARAERGIICLDEMDKIATAKVSHGKDVSGEGVQQALLKIIEGTTVQVQAKPERGSGSGSPGASAGRQQGFPTNSPLSGGNMGGSNSQSSAAPGKGEVYNVKTDNILFICAGAFNGLHKLILDRISKGSIGFGATVRATPGTNSSSSSSDQHETILEGEDDLYTSHLPFYNPQPSTTSPSPSHTPPRRRLNTLDLLEPQDLQTYGLIPELVGRIPLTCALSSLDIPSLVQVLTEPRNSLLQQYRQLFALSSIELRITTPALHVIAGEAQKMGTGARGLRTVLERLLADAMFETPGSGVKSVLVTEDVARKRTGAVFFGRGEGEEFRVCWAREEERWEEERMRREREEEDGEMEKRARNNSRGGAARTFEEYREKASAAGFG